MLAFNPIWLHFGCVVSYFGSGLFAMCDHLFGLVISYYISLVSKVLWSSKFIERLHVMRYDSLVLSAELHEAEVCLQHVVMSFHPHGFFVLLHENVALLRAIIVIDVVACSFLCRVMHSSVYVTCIVSDL